MRMTNWLRRKYQRYLIWKHSADHLRRRSKVEAYLFKVAEGKKEPPNADKCRDMAILLGVPGKDLKL